MGYRILDIDVSEALPPVAPGPETSGLALLVRAGEVPVDFILVPSVPSGGFSEKELAGLVAAHSADAILEAAIRREITPAAAPPSYPSVTVAICTRNRPDLLTACLASLHRMERPGGPAGASLELLVVDNAPPDTRTREAVAAFPDVRYVVEPRPGLDFARNRALAEASGELLAFVDDDVIVDRNWFRGLLDAAHDHPDAAAFTGLVLPAELETEAQILFEQNGGFRRGFRRKRYEGAVMPGNPLYPCGAGIFGAGANMAFRRSVLQELGGFDEALDTGAPLPGGGDLDIFYRVVRAGRVLLYDPSFLAFHHHRRELAALRRQYRSWGLGFMAFVAKTYASDVPSRSKLRRLVVWWFGYQLRQLARSLAGVHPLPPSMIVEEIRGGLKGLCGEYGRSRRRIARIREGHVLRAPRYAPVPPDPREEAEQPSGPVSLEIVICTYNRADLLDRTLAALARQQTSARIDWRVLVVNNSCTDHTARVVADHIRTGRIPGLRQVIEREQGLTPARLRGAVESSAGWIAFVDDDCVVDERWVDRAAAFARRHPRCGAFGGRVVLAFGGHPPAYLHRYGWAYAEQDHGEESKVVPCLVGAGMVIRKAALVESGWMHHRFLEDRRGEELVSGGDVEIALRIREAGYELWYAPECRLHHVISPQRTTRRYLLDVVYGLGISQVLGDSLVFRGTYARWLRTFAARALRGVLDAARAAVTAPRSETARVDLAVRWRFLRGNVAGISQILRMNGASRRALLGAAGRRMFVGAHSSDGRPEPAEGASLHVARAVVPSPSNP